MRKVGAFTAAVTVLVLTAQPVESTESSTRPPTQLHKVGDHWTPWNPPEAGAGDYIIQKGDTLWDLAGKWFNDPFLWPQIWDENRYILDSHWIYPGDPLVVPGRPTVVPATGELPVATLVPEEDTATEPQETAPSPSVVLPQPAPLLPAADPSDLYCTGFIRHLEEAPELWIAGRENEQVAVAEGDVVYLNHGRDAGLRAGDEYAVMRRHRTVYHPSTGADMGTMVRRMGRVRVLIVHETTSTAVITMSCEDLYERDELVPWTDITAPLLSEMPEFDRLDIRPSGGPQGHVVAVRDDLSVVGAGHLIFTDLGLVSGAKPGDTVKLFRVPSPDLPRLMLGQAIVLTVHEGSSVAKILVSVRESEIGDRVELWR